jgi:hypothetical protein
MGEKIWGLSKTASNYKPAVKSSVRCDACRYMFPRLPVGTCKLVRGLIKGSHTCDEFLPAGGRKSQRFGPGEPALRVAARFV